MNSQREKGREKINKHRYTKKKNIGDDLFGTINKPETGGKGQKASIWRGGWEKMHH